MEDHLGSSSVTLDVNGALFSKEEYFPFGETSFGSFAKKRYRYVGKEKDEESGLYYYGARYYAAWTCRFVSVDPLALSMPFMAPYVYAANDPIGQFDVDGMNPSGGGGDGLIGPATKAAEAAIPIVQGKTVTITAKIEGSVDSTKTNQTDFFSGVVDGLVETYINIGILVISPGPVLLDKIAEGMKETFSSTESIYKFLLGIWIPSWNTGCQWMIDVVEKLGKGNNYGAGKILGGKIAEASVVLFAELINLPKSTRNEIKPGEGEIPIEQVNSVAEEVPIEMEGVEARSGGTSEGVDGIISNKLRVQKQVDEHIIGGSRLGTNSYLNSVDDATRVLNAANSGEAIVLSTNLGQNRAYVQYNNVTGYYNNNGVIIPTNKFLIKGGKSSTVVPIHPNSTTFR
ncbi:MAG: hypothetical protein H6581_31160 [Bacteroidia bacterium]|nr:hypothetical protein [Bacteroidia bacterium]